MDKQEEMAALAILIHDLRKHKKLTLSQLAERIGRSVGRASAWACVATTAACAIVAFSPIIALDGARGVGPILTVMCIHGWLAVRMGPRPIGDPRESA